MSGAGIDASDFCNAFDRFCALVEARSGHPFRGFDEGLAAAWESYKPRLRDHALGLLRPQDWLEDEIGSGAILNRTIEAIEIQDSRLKLTNNLVFWQNRFGHANRDHRVMLETASNPVLRGDIESLLFGLYRGTADEGVTFDGLVGVTGGKYPLLAYLFFLKDIDRFMPIQPTGFARAFHALGIEFTTVRQCCWANYTGFNATSDRLRPLSSRVVRKPTETATSIQESSQTGPASGVHLITAGNARQLQRPYRDRHKPEIHGRRQRGRRFFRR